MILVDGFYEWQWLDAAGKRKIKYKIALANNDAFAIAGIFNDWIEPETGELIKTIAMITCEANDFMRVIHNSKMRMPLMLTETNESQWLNNKELIHNKVTLIANQCDGPPSFQQTLF